MLYKVCINYLPITFLYLTNGHFLPGLSGKPVSNMLGHFITKVSLVVPDRVVQFEFWDFGSIARSGPAKRRIAKPSHWHGKLSEVS
jgi:hypothetical protein